MFVTITTDSDDLSYLLFKHPARVQRFDLGFGQATLWFPVAEPEHCQAALLVDVDQFSLARSKRLRSRDFELGAYVNDRAWAASSLLAVALSRVFHSALKGQDPADRPGAATTARPYSIHLPSVHPQGPRPSDRLRHSVRAGNLQYQNDGRRALL